MIRRVILAALGILLLLAAPSAQNVYRPRISAVAALSVTISNPTTSPLYSTSVGALDLSGVQTGGATMAWANTAGAGTNGSCTIIGTVWQCSTITLTAGANPITVTVSDDTQPTPNTASALLTVTYTVSDVTNPTVVITSPTSSATLATALASITLGGTASDNIGVVELGWTCAACPITSGSIALAGSWSETIALGTSAAGVANTIIVTGRDAASNTGTDQIVVTSTSTGPAPLTLLTSSMGACTVGTPYTRTFTATGGAPPYTFTRQSGDVFPTGLTLSSPTLSGTPSVAHSKTFVMRVTDSAASTDDSGSLTLNCVVSGAEGPDDFFNEMVALPEEVASWSLRSDASLSSVCNAACLAGGNWRYIHDNGTDNYSDPQDATKLITGASVTDQLNFNLNSFNITDGSVLIIADFYYGPEFKTSTKANWQQKNYNIRDYPVNASKIWLELNHEYKTTEATSDLGGTPMRLYNLPPSQTNGLVLADPYEPTGLDAEPVGSWHAATGTWTRYWWEVILSQPGTAFPEWNTLTGQTLSTWNIASSAAGATTTVTTTAPFAMGNAGDTVIVTLASTGVTGLDGVHVATIVDSTHFTVPVTTSGTASTGTVSRHWHMVSVWAADETRNPVRILYRVPHIIRNTSNNGRIVQFDFEFNSSSGSSEKLHGWDLVAAPTIANPTVLETTTNDLATGDWVIAGGDVVKGPYQVTRLSATTFSVPQNVTSLSYTNAIATSQTCVGLLTGGGVPVCTQSANPHQTLITTTAPHKFQTDAFVEISGHSDASLNGIHKVRKTAQMSSSQFSIPPAGSGGTGGSAIRTTHGYVAKALIGYGKNVVILRNLANPEATMRKPVR